MGCHLAVRTSHGGGGAIPSSRQTRQSLSAAVGALLLAAGLALIPVLRMGKAAPLLALVVVAAVGMLLVAIVTGSAAAQAIALLLFLGVFEVAVLTGVLSLWIAPSVAAGLFIVSELTSWSAAVAGRGPGWSVMYRSDGAVLAVGAVAVGGVTALVLAVSTGLPVTHGVLVQAMGVAAAAAAAALLWALAREGTR